ncbi:MAG: hypothetical protein N3A69_15855, partial [Leptospiraceae bacterium]|nr:hypothetical protein [Leptospiraceae bacterium]
IQLDLCRAVFVIDEIEYYRIKEGEKVLDYEFLNYQPKNFYFIEKEKVISAPISPQSVIFIFLKDYDEEVLQVFQDLQQVVRLACENIEFRKKKEKIIEVLKESLEHFQFLADKLRNPLSIIFGALEIKDEVGIEKACIFVKEGAERIRNILDELSDHEGRIKNISKTIF